MYIKPQMVQRLKWFMPLYGRYALIFQKNWFPQDFSVFRTLQAAVETAQRYEAHTQSTVTRVCPHGKYLLLTVKYCMSNRLINLVLLFQVTQWTLWQSFSLKDSMWVKKQVVVRLSSGTVTNRPNQANGNVNSYVSSPQTAQICLNCNRNIRARCSAHS